jgi:hypothetical protein
MSKPTREILGGVVDVPGKTGDSYHGLSQVASRSHTQDEGHVSVSTCIMTCVSTWPHPSRLFCSVGTEMDECAESCARRRQWNRILGKSKWNAVIMGRGKHDMKVWVT